jgi:hypothetical protein
MLASGENQKRLDQPQDIAFNCKKIYTSDLREKLASPQGRR